MVHLRYLTHCNPVRQETTSLRTNEDCSIPYQVAPYRVPVQSLVEEPVPVPIPRRLTVQRRNSAAHRISQKPTYCCTVSAPSLTKSLVKQYRYSSEYRTTVQGTLLFSCWKYAASQARPASQLPASLSASCSGVVHKQYLPPCAALQVPQRTAVAEQRGKVPRWQTQ